MADGFRLRSGTLPLLLGQQLTVEEKILLIDKERIGVIEPVYLPLKWLKLARSEQLSLSRLAGRLLLWIGLWALFTVLYKLWVTVPWWSAILLTVVLQAFGLTVDAVRIARWRRATH